MANAIGLTLTKPDLLVEQKKDQNKSPDGSPNTNFRIATVSIITISIKGFIMTHSTNGTAQQCVAIMLSFIVLSVTFYLLLC